MTPAEKRIEEQVERWLASLDMHLQYVDLPDQAYNRAQPWPVHDRPSKLTIELARQKTLELLDMLAARRTAGDSKFADAMELMTYLANNVGLQPMQRFIPLADPAYHKTAPPAQSAPTPSPPAPQQRAAAKPTPAPTVAAYGAPNFDDEYDAPADADDVDVHETNAEDEEISVEIEADDPAPLPAPRMTPQPPPRPATIVTAAPGRKVSAAPPPPPPPPPVAKPAPPPPPPAEAARAPTNQAPPQAKQAAAPKVNASADKEQQTVIADAVRLMAWGKSWHELAEAIARMANRPPIAEVRRILRAQRAEIERLAAEAKPG